MTEKPPLYLIDASVYVFRAWFAIPESLRDGDGQPINALHGFAGFLGELLGKARPDYLAVCFDESLNTSFRNEIDPAYKAQREEAPPSLKAQFQRCRALCTALGLAHFADPRFEADDLIGTLAARGRAAGHAAIIVTRDKDLCQLIHPGDALWDAAGERRWTAADIEGHYGVTPAQFADYLALVGDPVDNIRGVPGVGAKTAAALLRAYGSLAGLYANLDTVPHQPLRGAAALAQRLAAARDAAFVAQQLSQIVCDVPMPATTSALRWQPPARSETLAQLKAIGLGAGGIERLLRNLARASIPA